MDENQGFLLGQIVQRLNANDACHTEIKAALKHIDEKLDSCMVDQAVLKTKASMWGGIVAFITSISITVFVKLFIK